ncbi:MAG: alpha-L-rhamnosidase [Candidatus Omnitrophica bacterium]|nr:alpha-L-rhamnosidase [Candidatus Omnitrophota bacterium]
MRINKELLEKPWTAGWIIHPEGPACDFGVFHFRKKLHFRKVPRFFIIHVSADNRYRLFVNGKSVSRGPCRGDLNRWFFETVDIARYLHAGDNVIAAVVWNFGTYRPIAQITFQTRFLLQGNSEKERIADTRQGNGWNSFYNKGYAPYMEGMETSFFIAVGPGEKIDGNLYPWGWEKEEFDDSCWQDVRKSFPRALPREDKTWGGVSYLVPRPIPFMVEERGFFKKAVLSGGVEVPDDFICGRKELVVPPESSVSLILDNGVMTTAYPEMEISGGKGASVTACYAESMRKGGEKGNRNEVAGKTISGISDCFMPDGGEGRVFSPLWWRAFRYVQVKIVTGRETLRIKKFTYLYTGYPFREKGSFKSDDGELKKIWNAGWRTARLCAHETYLDCPYYEQLQYVGDTRIQALISLYVGGDDRLMKKAIREFSDSRMPDGLTLSQYPGYYLQVIPPFSLIWINMLNDYYRFRNDRAFVREMLSCVRSVLHWFEERLDAKTGLLGPLPWWNFVDWAEEYKGGVSPGAEEGNSSVVSLLFVNSLLDAAEMEAALGDFVNAARYKKLAGKIKKAVMEHCRDERKGLLADTPAKKHFSQHANVLAVLTDTLPRKKHHAVMKRVLDDRSIIQCTYYFQYYLHQAVNKAGLGDRYISLLEPWRKMLSMGLTTFAEKPEPTRSDCHAWSAHPNVNLLAIVCGISPAEPGFKSVRIEPHLGPLERVEGSMPHPYGNIKVKVKKVCGGISAEITLPKGLDGIFVYGKTAIALKPGKQVLKGVK